MKAVAKREKWDRRRFHQLVESFKKRKILVVGDIGLDRYTLGEVSRISPEAPVPIVKVEQENLKLGLAANVADNIRVLSGEPILVGAIGKDRSGEDFRRVLRQAKIADTSLLLDRNRRTTLKDRIVSERQQLLRVDYEDRFPISPATEKLFIQKVKDALPFADMVVLEDYAKGVVTQGLAAQLFDLAQEARKKVLIDPNDKTPVHFYRGATALTPNKFEAEKLTGIEIKDTNSLKEAGKKFLEKTEAQYAIFTLGKEGMAIFTQGKENWRHIPTYAREVYDVSGAGDTVIAVLALALSSGATLEEAATLGNLAAGVEVGKRGTATVSPEELGLAVDFFAGMAPRQERRSKYDRTSPSR